MTFYWLLLLTGGCSVGLQLQCDTTLKNEWKEELYISHSQEENMFLPADEPRNDLFTSGHYIFPKYGKTLDPVYRNDTVYRKITFQIIQEVKRCMNGVKEEPFDTKIFAKLLQFTVLCVLYFCLNAFRPVR